MLHIGRDGTPKRCRAQKGNCPLTKGEEGALHFDNENDLQTFYKFTEGNAWSRKNKFTNEMTNREKMAVILNDPNTPPEVISAIKASTLGNADDEKQLVNHENAAALDLRYIRSFSKYDKSKDAAIQREKINNVVNLMEEGKFSNNAIAANQHGIKFTKKNIETFKTIENKLLANESDRERIANGLKKMISDPDYYPEKYAEHFKKTNKTGIAKFAVYFIAKNPEQQAPIITKGDDKLSENIKEMNFRNGDEVRDYIKGIEYNNNDFASSEEIKELNKNFNHPVHTLNALRKYRDNPDYEKRELSKIMSKTDKRQIDKYIRGAMQEYVHYQDEQDIKEGRDFSSAKK